MFEYIQYIEIANAVGDSTVRVLEVQTCVIMHGFLKPVWICENMHSQRSHV